MGGNLRHLFVFSVPLVVVMNFVFDPQNSPVMASVHLTDHQNEQLDSKKLLFLEVEIGEKGDQEHKSEQEVSYHSPIVEPSRKELFLSE